jgi:hypothetical protein
MNDQSMQEYRHMNSSISSLAAAVLLTMTVHTGFAAEPVRVPATPEAAASADLIARADRALRDYVAASSAGDEEAIARIVTSDAMVEYALQEPGTYLAVEAAALSAHRSGHAKQTRPGAHISNLWIFPTPDSNTVFVHYTIGSDVRSSAQPDSEHLALLEMRGDGRADHPGAWPKWKAVGCHGLRVCPGFTARLCSSSLAASCCCA